MSAHERAERSQPVPASADYRVAHVIDNLQPGGAQHILAALLLDDPGCAVCALHGQQGVGSGAFSGADILSGDRLALASILTGLFRRVMRWRATTIVNAHLEASTLFLCVLRHFVAFRLVVTVHATVDQWSPWFRSVFRRIIGRADHVVMESHTSLEELRAMGVPAERLTLIPLGTTRARVDSGALTADIRREFDIPAGTPIFLNVARMVPGKGQIHLVRAMASVPDAVAVIVGFGPEEAALRTEVDRLGLQARVRFAGRRTDLDNFYAVARAFVMPCVDQGMGIVIYDALTYHLPVVAYARGAIGEVVIDGENGYLLEPDPEALAAAMNRVLRDETQFRFREAAAYSAQPMVAAYRALYAGLARRWFGAGG